MSGIKWEGMGLREGRDIPFPPTPVTTSYLPSVKLHDRETYIMGGRNGCRIVDYRTGNDMLYDEYDRMHLMFDCERDVIRLYGDEVCLLAKRWDDEALLMYARWDSDEEIAMFVAQHNVVPSVESERRYAEARQGQDDYFGFNIMETGSQRIVGDCSLHLSEANGIVGITIGDPEARGRGLGTEAMRMLIGFAFDELRLHRLELIASADNGRALRCYERLGFERCGHLREVTWSGGRWHDAIIMQLLCDDWKASGMMERKATQEG